MNLHMKTRHVTGLLLTCLLFGQTLSATVYRVGNAWGEKKDYGSLQELIDAGAGKASTDEIWLAGEHILTSQWTISTWQGKLYGGFSGTENSVEERLRKPGGRGWEFLHPTTLKLAERKGQNSLICSFSYASKGEIVSLIDGICFDGSNCTATPLWFRQFSSSGVTIRNCIVEHADLPTNNVLDPGTADFEAGGIQLGSNDASSVRNVVIDECLIRNNKARVGAIVGNQTTVSNCLILDNTGVDAGKAGGIYAYGTTRINDCIVWNNRIGNEIVNAGRSKSGITLSASGCITNAFDTFFTEVAGNLTETDESALFADKTLTVSADDGVSLNPQLPETATVGARLSFSLTVPADKKASVTVNGLALNADSDGMYTFTVRTDTRIVIQLSELPQYTPVKATTASFDWEKFLAQHDMYWTSLTADPTSVSADNSLKTGYYAGALMGNGLIGTNLYKLKDNVYRLNAGRSDVTEIRKPYNLYNSARLPIGYFTLKTTGNVTAERMRLSIYNAITQGTFTTNKGRIAFKTYVHADENYIVFETDATGDEQNYEWDFVAQKAISPRQIMNNDAPAGYLNSQGKSNPDPERRTEGDVNLLIQKLATDNTFATIGRVYVVAWKEVRDGSKRRIIATIAQEDTEEQAVATAKSVIGKGFSLSSEALETSHKAWWNSFYRNAAFVSFPDTRFETFYWDQYYKFASTARPGKPIVDLQGVWPTWDTPWTAIWMNLNLQLTYSWQAKANLGFLAQPLWDTMYEHRDNLRRNVTDIPAQSTWTDAACLGRTATYDFLAPLSPSTVNTNQYEVGNLTWTLFYYWQHCMAYGDTEQLTTRLFPLLKSAVNLFFHIRTEQNGKYGLPATASPEYIGSNIGTNTNYDLSNLRWGLQTLIDINNTYGLNDPQAADWSDFLNNLTDFPYSTTTGYKVSDKYEFTSTSHRHYSHLFMIYPYHLVDWENPEDCPKMELSVSRWNGNQGYSRTGKAAMLLSKNDGDGALAQMQTFFDNFIKPNTLYAETGPVIETPMAAVSTLHEFYMQDWGNKIRVFWGMPSSWNEASFVNLRAKGAFLVSATRKNSRTVFVQIESEHGGLCRLQTGIPGADIVVKDLSNNNVPFTVVDKDLGVIEVNTSAGDVFQVINRTLEVEHPSPIEHPVEETLTYGDGKHSLPLLGISFSQNEVVIDGVNALLPVLRTVPEGLSTDRLIWSCGNPELLDNRNGLFFVRQPGETWIAFETDDKAFTDTCRITIKSTAGELWMLADADSYVHDGNKSGNFGSEPTACVKMDNSGYQRMAFYRFPLNIAPPTDENFKATVSFYVNSTGETANSVNWLFKASGTAWTEDGLTWNNKPATTDVLTEIKGFNVSDGYRESQRISFDITDYVKQEAGKGQKAISLCITQSARGTGGGGSTFFATKENADGRRLPLLILQNAEMSTAVSVVEQSSDSPTRYYTTDGVEVTQPISGRIYIIKEGNRVRKVLAI